MKNITLIIPVLCVFALTVLFPDSAFSGGNQIILMGESPQGGANSSTQSNSQVFQNQNQQQGNQYSSGSTNYCPYGGCYGQPQQATIQIVSIGNGQGGIVLAVGDRLYFIASLVFYNPYGWRDIYYNNMQNMQNPNNIQNGTVAGFSGTTDQSLYNLINQPGSMFNSQPISTSGNSSLFSNSSNYSTTPGFNWSSPVSSGNNSSSAGYTSSYNINQQQQQTSSSGAFNCAAPIQTGTVTSNFGPRTLRGEPNNHGGIDIGAPAGTPIKSTGDGVVIFSGNSSGYGNVVKVQHSDGTITIYGHCRSLNVRQGQRVSAGEMIATVNSTGNSTGNHLHYEIKRNGTSVDPRNYFTFPAKGSSVNSSNIIPRG